MKTIGLLSYLQFKELLGEAKKISDPAWCRFVLRPLSFPVGWLIYKTGMTANSISLISIVITVFSSFILVIGSANSVILVSFLMLLVGLLDCIDGNVARARGETGPGGEWMDAFSGYTVYALIPLALGIHIDLYYPLSVLPGFWIIVGALTSISNLFLRLLYQKFVSSKLDEFTQKDFKGSDSLFSRFSSEMGLVGWMMPVLLVASITNMLEVYLALYCFFYMTSAVMISIILVRKITSPQIR
jgi:phosphatidylglycerophosphate synthase